MTRNHFLKTLTVLIIAVSAGISCPHALAQVSFSDNFADATLRVDYCFSGDAGGQSLSLDCLESSDGWYGRRVNLAAPRKWRAPDEGWRNRRPPLCMVIFFTFQ